MKGNAMKKLLASAAALLLTAVVIVPGVGTLKANAVAGSNYLTARTEAETMKKTTFQKNFQIRNDCNIPDASFKFEVTPGTAVAATEDTIVVYAGVIPGLKITPLTGTAVTAAADAGDVAATLDYNAQTKENAETKQADKTQCDNVTYFAPTGKDYYIATKTVELDFTNVVFTEPGVYRYVIEEVEKTNRAITYDSKARTLDVFVEDDTKVNQSTGKEEKKLKITGYVLYVDEVKTAPKDGTTTTTGTAYVGEDEQKSLTPNGLEPENAVKSLGFVNKYPTASLTFGKEVTGNQGSKDKYFEMTLEIANGPANAVLVVDLSEADKNIAANPNKATTKIKSAVAQPESITLNASGAGSETFYLQDGQYITVYGFIKDMTFTLSEEKEEYTQIAGIDANLSGIDYDSAHTGNDELKDDISAFDADTNPVISGTFTPATTGGNNVVSKYTGFTNYKEGVIPTGVILSVAPWIIAGMVILAGIAFFVIRSGRKYEEE